MEFTGVASSNGVVEQIFTLDGIPGVLWTPDGAGPPHPLIVIGHGGGQHKQAPSVVARAERLVAEGGYAVVAVDAPAHGGRPRSEGHERLIAEMRARMRSGGDVTAALADLHTLIAGQSVPEW